MPNYFFINHFKCIITHNCAICRATHHGAPSLSKILTVLDTPLLRTKTESAYIESVIGVYNLSLQRALYRGLPFEMIIIQENSCEEPTSFSIKVSRFFEMVHKYGKMVIIRI